MRVPIVEPSFAAPVEHAHSLFASVFLDGDTVLLNHILLSDCQNLSLSRMPGSFRAITSGSA